MADRARARLDRLLRVRTLQLGQTRAAETAAAARLSGEAQLRDRIAALAADVAPRAASADAATLATTAAFRERLHASATAADARHATAQAAADRASQAVRDARRDQSAIEKLIARAGAAATLREVRALQNAPPTTRKRHDPC